MTKLSDIKQDISIAVIGDTGSGKTFLLGTLCQLVPTVLVTADVRGLETLRKQGAEPADIILVTSWNDAWEHYLKLKQYAASGTIQALAIDNFGAAQARVEQRINTMPRGEKEARQNTNEREDMVRRASMLGDRKLGLPQWGDVTAATEAWLDEVLALPFSIRMLTVLPEVRDDLRSGQERLYPAISGSMRYGLFSRFSMVLNTFIEMDSKGEALYCATGRPHPRISTKDTYGAPRTWVAPTMARILRHVKGAERDDDRETAEEQRIGIGAVAPTQQESRRR